MNQVPKTSEISLRMAVIFVTGGSTQGFVHCHCRRKCQVNLCYVKKKKQMIIVQNVTSVYYVFINKNSNIYCLSKNKNKTSIYCEVICKS